MNQPTDVISENKKVHFTYDPLGRRLSKTVYEKGYFGWWEICKENYLWDGQNEIGAFDENRKCLNFKILGRNAQTPVAIEIDDEAYAPILDIQGNIRYLLSLSKIKINNMDDYTAFGEKLKFSHASLFNPWSYAGKRWDPEIGMYYFGKRYYDPSLARWLTTDPGGFIDSANLYQYLYNNPFRYIDPDGQFVFAIPLIVWGVGAAAPTLATLGVWAAAGAATGAIAYGGYKLVEVLNQPGYDPNVIEELRRYDSPSMYKSGDSSKSTNVEGSNGSSSMFPEDPKNDDKYRLQLEKQHNKGGEKSIVKSYRSLKKHVGEHRAKLEEIEYKSSVEREIRTFDRQIRTIEEFARSKNIDLLGS